MPDQIGETVRRYVNLPTHSAALPFSDGVQVGNTLYLSGRIGIDPATGAVPAQTTNSNCCSTDVRRC